MGAVLWTLATAAATVVEPLDDAALLAGADRVVVGQVIDTRVAWGDTLVTVSTVEVSSWEKGDPDEAWIAYIVGING